MTAVPATSLRRFADAWMKAPRRSRCSARTSNSFGYGIGDRYAFSKLLRACGTIEGFERVRFTSPHPAAFTDDVIAAMAETPNVMHQLHMPLQSGSDKILRAMRRSYRSAKFLDILRKVREAMPDAQISTDIIVGFPGETDEDFEATMDVVRRRGSSRRSHSNTRRVPEPPRPKWNRFRMRSCRNGSTGW